MKPLKIILLLVCLLPLAGLRAQTLYAEQFDRPVETLIVEENASVNLQFVSPNAPNQVGLQSSLPLDESDRRDIVFSRNTLTVKGNDAINLSLRQGTLVSILARDNAQLRVGTQGETLNQLHLIAKGNSTVRFEGTDSLRFNQLEIETADNGQAVFYCPVVCNQMQAKAAGLSNIIFSHSASGNKAILATHDLATITIPQGEWNTLESEQMGDSRVHDGTIADHAERSATITYRSPFDSFDFLAACGMTFWASPSASFSGAPYEVSTHFGAWQFEVRYNFLFTRHIALSMGLGLKMSKYRFSNPSVYYDEDSRTFTSPTADPTLTDGTYSHLATRAIVLPLSFTFVSNNNFCIDITALPGLAFTNKRTGLYHHYEYLNGTASDYDHSVEGNLPPLQCDLRLSLGTEWLRAYAQVGLTPLFQEFEQPIHGCQFGLLFQL